MNGSLRQRGASSWELRVYAGTDPATGKMRYETRTVRGSQYEARAELESFAGQVSSPRRRALDTTMGELFDQWYANASPGWAVNTVRHTHSVVKVHLRPRFGDLSVGKVATADIDDFYAELRARGGRDGRPLADGTVRRIHGVLHRALAQAVRWQWIWTNPAEHASPPIVDQREIASPPASAVAKLLAVTRENLALHAYFRLSVSTGARRGQMCALRWHDIDLERGTVCFARALAEGRRGGLEVVATKNKRRNRVEIDDDTLDAVRRHREQVERQAEAARSNVDRGAYVFANDPAGDIPWQPNWTTKQFRRLRAETGLTGYRLHDLRHFMATEMLAAGVPIPIVAARLAHARSSTTLNVYAHAVPGGDRDAANGLAARLAAAG